MLCFLKRNFKKYETKKENDKTKDWDEVIADRVKVKFLKSKATTEFKKDQ